MAKRLFGLVWFAFEPFGKLPKVINELPVEVLDAPLDLILSSENRRNLSRRQLMRQTVHHKPINHFQRADMLENCAKNLPPPYSKHPQTAQ